MKVAIYCRLSEEDRHKADPRADSESIQNQKDMLLKFALEKGWDVYGIYSDDDYRGSDRDRPEFNRLLRDAEERRFQIVLCKSQSRFTRELELVEKLIHGRFAELGIRFVGYVDNADTEVKGNKKARQINGLVNEWYLEDLSESVSAALDTKRQRGEHIGSFALYGYLKSSLEKGFLVIDEKAAPIVRRIFHLFNEGYGLAAIAQILNNERIANPTWYKAALGMKTLQKKRASLGSTWSVNTVKNILRNRIYVGDLVQGRYERISYKSRRMRTVPRDRWFVTEQCHEPIIDRDLWNATQHLLRQRTRSQKNGTVHLFAGMTRCMECGSALHANHAKGIKYLRCPAGEVAKGRCGGTSIRLQDIEHAVLEGIQSLVHNCCDEEELGRSIELRVVLEKEAAAITTERTQQLRALEDLKSAALSLYLDKAKAVISEDDYGTLAQGLSERRASVERRLQALEVQIETLDCKHEARQSKADIIAKYKHITELNRELVTAFVERIEVGQRDKEARTVTLKIVWKV